MLDLNRLVWVVCCLLILSGCATHLKKSGHAVDVDSIVEALDADVLYQLGRDYQEKKDYSAAINAYEEALALEPENSEIYNAMGVVYSILNEHELAIQFINEAIHYEPMASHLHNNLGFAYLRWEYVSEAAGAFHRALKLDPKNEHARHNLAVAYEKMGCTDNEPCGQWQEPTRP